MQVVINVNEDMFKDVLENELKAFSKEELHEVIHEAIKTYLTQEDSPVKSLFLQAKYHGYYGSPSHELEATPLLRNACENMDFSEDLEELKEEVSKVLKEDAKTIIADIFAKAISKSFIELLQHDYSLSDMITGVVHQHLNQIANRQ